MAITQADIRRYIEKTTGEKQYEPSKITVVSRVPLNNADQNAAAKAKFSNSYSIAAERRRQAVRASTAAAQQKSKREAIREVEIPSAIKITAQHYGSNPVIRTLLQKDPASMSVWISQNMQTYKKFPKAVQEYMDYAIVQSQSKQAREVPGAARVMAGGSGFTSAASLGMNRGIDQSSASRELEEALNAAHPVANFVGKGLGYTVNSAVPDELLLGAFAAKKAGQSILKQATRTGAALGTSNMAQGLVEDTVTGKTAKEKAANAALNFGFGGVLGGFGGAMAARKGVMLPTGREIAERQAKRAAPITKSEGLNQLEVDVFNGGRVSKDMPTIIKEYKASTDKDLVGFAKKAIANKEDNRSSYGLGEVIFKEIQDLQRTAGVNTEGFTHSISAKAIRHINNDHGLNGKTDKSMTNLDDIARIQYVLNNYDNMEKGSKASKEFMSGNNAPAQTVVYSKRINGTYYVVEAVPDTKAKKLQIVTAYIRQNKKEAEQALNMPTSGPQFTPEAPHALTSSNTNISQGDRGVNNIIRNNAKNNAGLAGEITQLTKKAADYKAKAERNLIAELKNVLSVPYADRRGLLANVVSKISDDILANGKINRETADRLFEEVYEAGRITVDDFYKAHKELKADIRRLKLDISEGDRANIADFAAFRKENFGNFTIAKRGKGVSVDKAYQELNEMYPDLFPETITMPSDQLRQISTVSKSIAKIEKTLDEYYGPQASEFKKYARYYFDEALDVLENDVNVVKRYEAAKTAETEPFNGLTDDEIKDVILKAKPFREVKDKAVKNNLLTTEDNKVIEDLLKGNITVDKIPEGYNKQGILEVYNSQKAYKDVRKPIFEHIEAAKKHRLKYGTVEVTNETGGFTQEAISLARTELVDMATEIQGNKLGKIFGGKAQDIDRIIEAVSGKSKELYEALKNNLSRPLYAAKAKYSNAVKAMTDSLYNDVVQKLGIRKGSKESAAVQWIGEGQRQVKGEIVPYDLADLKKDFPQSWQKILEAEQWFRKQYDDYVNKINRQLEIIYPNPFDDAGELIQGRRLIARKDYFHHFLEEANKPGLRDILNNTSTDIDPRLVGLSENTKPKSKFWGALQQRTERGAYTEDAVGGFLNYLPAAEYKINIEPVLPQFRAVIRDIQEATAEAGTTNANKFIGWLTQYTNVLAGKTNPIDRMVHNISDEGGRKFLTVLDRVSGRMRSNAVMANVSSMISQVYNLPNVLAYVKDPRYIAQGYAEAVMSKLGKGEAADLLARSPFLNERYLSRSFRRFDEGVIKNGNRLFARCLEIGDEGVAKGGWLAAYRKAVSEGLENPIEYADELIRKSIAGRGIGEMPLAQQSKLIKAFAPFQVEVNNTFNMLKELVGKKDALAITEYMIGIWLLNEGRARIDGNQIGFDPISTTKDNVEKWDSNKSFAENMANSLFAYGGNFLGNAVMGGQYIGEATDKLLETGGYNQSLFGEQDPSRFGTGNIAINTLAKPLAQSIGGKKIDLLTPTAMVALPYGGKQLVRSTHGLQDVGILPKVNIQKDKGLLASPYRLDVEKQDFPASYSGGKGLRFLIDTEGAAGKVNAAKAVISGSFATKEGRAYLQAGAAPFGVKTTQNIEKGNKLGIAPKDYIKIFQKINNTNSKDAKRLMIYNSDFTPSQKAWFTKVNDLDLEQGIDYTDKYTFKLTTEYSDKVQGYAKNAKAVGIDTEKFLSVYDVLDDVGSTKSKTGKSIYLSASRNKKALIDKMVYTKAQRQLFYEMFNVSEKLW